MTIYKAKKKIKKLSVPELEHMLQLCKEEIDRYIIVSKNDKNKERANRYLDTLYADFRLFQLELAERIE